MTPREVVGAVITILGILLIGYSLTAGAIHHAIGVAGKVSGDALSAILGWFLVIIGPAVWFGETPVALRRQVTKKPEER